MSLASLGAGISYREDHADSREVEKVLCEVRARIIEDERIKVTLECGKLKLLKQPEIIDSQ